MNNRRMRIIFCIMVLLMLCLTAGCGRRNKENLENEKAYRQLGINKMTEGDYEEAVKMFQKALDQSLAVIGELEIDICYYKAAAQYKAGDMDGAMQTYTALIDYDEKNADALYLRGTLYLTQGDSDSAMADYENALKADKKNGTLYNKIGERLNQSGFTQEAEKIWNRGLALKGDTAAEYRERGYAYLLLGQYDSAKTYLDKANELGDTEAVFYLGKMYEALGETEKAGELYESYIGTHSDDTETLNALGCAKMEAGDYEKALVFFQAALKNENPTNKRELLRNEIAALEYTLDFAQAREKMESYLADYPDDEAATREYEFLKSR